MAGWGSPLLFVVTCCLISTYTYGDYVITTPREVTHKGKTQLCFFITQPDSPEGSIHIVLQDRRYFGNREDNVLPVHINRTVPIPAGKVDFCEDIQLDERVDSDAYRGLYVITGSINGKNVNYTEPVGIRKKNTERTFIQTDKHLYQPGQTVQMRILTVQGPFLAVSKENYPEIFVETPSGTRIAQWLDVDNSAGLVHLNLTLVDEPEEGSYNIKLKTKRGTNKYQDFRVEEYVLPRFEVTIKPPKYVTATDNSFSFDFCAQYTFGQPVKGNLTLTVDNTQRELCRTKITKQDNITGCQTYEFTTAEMQVTDCDVYSISVDVNFEEEGTGVQRGTRNTISITRNPINFREVYADTFMKPNLPMTVKVKAQYPDDSPASGVPIEVCAAGKCNNMTTAPNGIFTAVLPNYKTNRIFMKTTNCRADIRSASYSKNIEHFYSPSNSSLMIYAPEDELKCESGKNVTHTLPVLFAATNQSSAIFRIQVISRGQVQYSSSKEFTLTPSELPINKEHLIEPLPAIPEGTVTGVINIPLELPSSASPTVKILIWYTRDDGEVVADNREIKVAKCLSNSANLSWSIEQGQPGDETTVSIASEPDSICSLGVVDKSTQLLSQQSDLLTLDSLFNFADDFDIHRYTHQQQDDQEYCNEKERKEKLELLKVNENAQPGQFIAVEFREYYYSSLYSDTIRMFDESGLYVFTDHTVDTRPCEKEEHRVYETVAFAGPAAAFGGSAGPAPSPPIQGDIGLSDKVGGDIDIDVESNTPRTDFPETWLWDIVVVPATGIYNELVTLPDTITDWVGKAICTHSEKGVGLSKEKSITTFLPFFIDLTLPPSIKRGEILPVKISVFNYLNQDLPVTVRLEESTEYEILADPNNSGPKGQKTLCLKSQDKDLHTVRINALELGDVNLTVTAYVDHDNGQSCGAVNKSVTRRDTIIKPIKVEAEGYPREKTWTKYICTKDFETGEDSFEEWDASTPAEIVKGSDRGWVTAVGDLLALSLENLGNLIRMPYGCGEQNMINFVPNIFIMKYLDATNQNTKESSDKLKRFMTTGYRRELLYRHSDGAFSAFGSADDYGSTWLTAFVLKSFAQARPYILVDEKDLNQTREWLQANQDPDGCFLSVGKVFHKGMKGGVTGGNSSIPLTTYVTISLLEAGENPADKSIVNAMKCINSNSTKDPYTMALKAYVYVLAKVPQAKQAIQDLLDIATVTKNATFWTLPNTPSRSDAVQMETAAYAILAMVESDFTTYEPQLRKIIKWMTAQRNGQGGFYSTQDTVMALQAMARFETFQYQGPLDVKATVTATNLTHTFSVTDKNKLLQQQVSLPSFPTKINMNLEGQGCAVIQAVLRYNIPEPEPSDAFDLTVNSITEPDVKCVTKRITTCTSYRLEDEKSNMAVIEVNLVSGYIPEKEDLKTLQRNNRDVIKRWEIDGNKVSFYIEELTARSTCINFRVIREIDVENVKPGSVVVYDYYQPEFATSKNYTLPANEECR